MWDAQGINLVYLTCPPLCFLRLSDFSSEWRMTVGFCRPQTSSFVNDCGGAERRRQNARRSGYRKGLSPLPSCLGTLGERHVVVLAPHPQATFTVAYFSAVRGEVCGCLWSYDPMALYKYMFLLCYVSLHLFDLGGGGVIATIAPRSRRLCCPA